MIHRIVLGVVVVRLILGGGVVVVVRVVEAILGEVFDAEGPRAGHRVVVNELSVHLVRGLLYLLVVGHVDDALRVRDGQLGELVRGPYAMQGDLGRFVEALTHGRLLGVVRIDVHLLAPYEYDLVQVEVGHVRDARERDAAVVDAAYCQILHEAVARLSVCHHAQVLHGRYGEVARSVEHHVRRMWSRADFCRLLVFAVGYVVSQVRRCVQWSRRLIQIVVVVVVAECRLVVGLSLSLVCGLSLNFSEFINIFSFKWGGGIRFLLRKFDFI